jgi:excinuclease ABC subunit A
VAAVPESYTGQFLTGILTAAPAGPDPERAAPNPRAATAAQARKAAKKPADADPTRAAAARRKAAALR